jgi:hypothetical protein
MRTTHARTFGGIGIAVILLLAVGAAVLISTWLYNAYNRALAWERPQFSQLETRGAGVAPSYQAADMMTFFDMLQHAIEENYGKQATHEQKKSPWTMRVRMQELVDGSLVIQVEADNKSLKREWTLKLASQDDFKNKVGGYGESIARDLSSTSGKQDRTM